MSKRALNKLSILVMTVVLSARCLGQSPFYSESLIKYDLVTHKADKPIPFDHSFTLVIDKLSIKGLRSVEAYEAKFEKGIRKHVANLFLDCDGKKRKAIVKDMDLRFNPYSDTLQIFFPPLRPNINFDVLVVYTISGKSRELLMDLNAMIAAGNPDASNAFDAFFESTIDDLFGISFCDIGNFADYQAFYKTVLAQLYTEISDPANCRKNGILTTIQVQAIDIVTSQVVSDFKDGNKLIELARLNLWEEMQNGLLDINKVFIPANEAFTSFTYGHTRLKNLESNSIFFDSVAKRVSRAVSNGEITVMVDGSTVSINTLIAALEQINKDLQHNISFLKGKLRAVNANIDNNEHLRQGNTLAGNTVSSDLKTASGNVLFLDAGYSNIVAAGINDQAVYIPKFYWGVSIYFRPIDKNTRRNRFPQIRDFSPPRNYGCLEEVDRNSDGSVKERRSIYGPDYCIASKRSLWKHLSLNIGVTLGKMDIKDFENFYNGTSLLVGPAYRFARGFKVSAGVALLKRTSKNPQVSDKKVVPGTYLSLSADIDIIQGIKDVTSILFK